MTINPSDTPEPALPVRTWRAGRCVAWTLTAEPTFTLDPDPQPCPTTISEHAPAIEARWNALRQDTPRLFDGPITAIDRPSPGAAHFIWRRCSYKALTCAPDSIAPIQLAVTGVLRAPDAALLIARRAQAVRAYPGMCEFAPAGGVEPPPDAASPITLSTIQRQCAAECEQELGPTIRAIASDFTSARPIGAVLDHEARSLDIVLLAPLTSKPDIPRDPRNWEVSSARWLSPQACRDLHNQGKLIDASALILNLLQSP